MTLASIASPRSVSLLALALALPCAISWAQDSEDSAAVNLAVAATPSTSYVSGHETLGAINDGFNPRNSNDRRRGQYGNWRYEHHSNG